MGQVDGRGALQAVPGLQAEEGKARLITRRCPRFRAMLMGRLGQHRLSGCDVGQVSLQEDESGARSEERLMGGVGHKGTAVSIREEWDEPPGWVPALGMRGMRVRRLPESQQWCLGSEISAQPLRDSFCLSQKNEGNSSREIRFYV